MLCTLIQKCEELIYKDTVSIIVPEIGPKNFGAFEKTHARGLYVCSIVSYFEIREYESVGFIEFFIDLN